MKRCPECRRDYFDDSLLYCLDDGSALLEGPAFIDDWFLQRIKVDPFMDPLRDDPRYDELVKRLNLPK
jgi:hypothetical protein